MRVSPFQSHRHQIQFRRRNADSGKQHSVVLVDLLVRSQFNLHPVKIFKRHLLQSSIPKRILKKGQDNFELRISNCGVRDKSAFIRLHVISARQV